MPTRKGSIAAELGASITIASPGIPPKHWNILTSSRRMSPPGWNGLRQKATRQYHGTAVFLLPSFFKGTLPRSVSINEALPKLHDGITKHLPRLPTMQGRIREQWYCQPNRASHNWPHQKSDRRIEAKNQELGDINLVEEEPRWSDSKMHGNSEFRSDPHRCRKMIWVFPRIGGTPKWMVYNGKSYENSWFGGPTPIFGNTHFKVLSPEFYHTQRCHPKMKLLFQTLLCIGYRGSILCDIHIDTGYFFRVCKQLANFTAFQWRPLVQ